MSEDNNPGSCGKFRVSSEGQWQRVRTWIGRKKWLVALPFLVGLLFPIGIRSASAAYYTGSWRVFGPVAGYTYTNDAALESSPSSDYAYTILELYNGGQIPGWYIGVQASLFDSSGALCVQSSVTWEPYTSYGLFTNSPVGQNCGSGYYYSKGWSHVYNGGTGYDIYGTYATATEYI